jgi:lipoprotein NlpI
MTSSRLAARAAVTLSLIASGASILCRSQTTGAQPLTKVNSDGSYTNSGGKANRLRTLEDGNVILADKTDSVSTLFDSATPSAAYCRHCHQESYHQWRQSLHSNSFRTPFYHASVDRLIKAKGMEYARYCDECHNPIPAQSDAPNAKSAVDRSFDQDGVSCIVCHSIKSAEPLGNGSFVFSTPAVIVDEKGDRIPGEMPDAEILAHLDRHSMAVMQDLYRKPEFCSACHKASVPPALNSYKWMRTFTTYDEWQDSSFSHQSPLVFYSTDYESCQDCHMRREAIELTDYGTKQGTLASHRWVAGNTAVPMYYGYSDQLDKTIAFLKSSNSLDVDLFALKSARSGAAVSSLGSEPVSLTRGEVVQAYVVIQNKGIGHSLIPELRDLYEAWVHFTVKDGSGATVYESGFLQQDGTLEPNTHSFVSRPIDGKGNFVDKHMVWDIRSEGYDNTIRPGHSVLVRYQFRIPDQLKGPLTITALVDYRHFRESYLDAAIGKDHPTYPIVELASQTRTFNIGSNLAAGFSKDRPSWFRWNNFGIALLDEDQFEEAEHAFNEVIRLNPDYKDGYINLGLTLLQARKYTEAQPPLEKALKLHPADARALYYLALVERHNGHLKVETADLESVVSQYPQCRDARRELGIAYESKHRDNKALQQFKALQAIDPDDLSAHLHLATLYRHMGMRKEAGREQAQYDIQKADPAAPGYSQEYIRIHPEILTETVPGHVHGDAPPALDAGSQ